MLYKKNPSAYTRCEKCRHIDRENEECKVANDKWLVCDDAGECRQFSQEGVNVKVNEARFVNVGDEVRCIDKGSFSKLTVGKIYNVVDVDVISDDAVFIKVANDKGIIVGYSLENFEIIIKEELDVDLSSKYHIHKEKLEKNPLEKLEKEKIKSAWDKKLVERFSKLIAEPTIETKELTQEIKKSNEKHLENEDNVNNNPIKPNHYKSGKFDVIAFCFEHELDFALGNVVKYVVRAGKKDSSKELEDLLKAKEFLNRKIERVKASE